MSDQLLISFPVYAGLKQQNTGNNQLMQTLIQSIKPCGTFSQCDYLECTQDKQSRNTQNTSQSKPV